MTASTPFAALDADQHSLAVDVADLEGGHLGHSQPGPVGDAECGPVLEAGRGRDQARGLVGAQHRRQFARISQPNELAGEVRPISGVVEEETQGGNSAVHGRRIHAALGLLDLEATDVLGSRSIGRALEKGSETGDGADVVVTGLVGKPADGHVLDEALTQGAGRCRREMVHDELLGLKEP